ncbi:small ubiquitin-related modifier 2-like [Choloepus didactylus]|uniref:small ubiquitin-related modifier 2-like n=1 Tax=Choloepus didactylus TaxID=27675 RepID=UPI00189DD6D0|nr:small ubiquitin-related modifier 2-like [Choloepus didactylus]
MADKKPKEGVKTENNNHINLKVAWQDGSVVQFRIQRHTSLSKLMKAYCERQDTPAHLELEDEDKIDVF